MAAPPPMIGTFVRPPRFMESTAAVCRARLLRWRDLVAFVGPLGHAQLHRHRAAALLLGLDGPFRIRAAGGDWTPAHAARVPAGLPHEVDGCAHRVAVVYLDPLLHGRALRPETIEVAGADADWVRRGRAALEAAGPARTDEGLRDELVEDVLPRSGPVAREPQDARVAALYTLLENEAGAAAESAAALARRLDLSASRFSHWFSARAGLSWTAYRNWRRLIDSSAELAQSPGAVTRIALDRGYSSPAHFAASFRAGFGITPSQLRGMRPRYEPMEPAAAYF